MLKVKKDYTKSPGRKVAEEWNGGVIIKTKIYSKKTLRKSEILHIVVKHTHTDKDPVVLNNNRLMSKEIYFIISSSPPLLHSSLL